MAPKPSTRNDPSRVHERPPDPAEASRTPIVPRRPHDPQPDESPKRRFSHQAQAADPTSDSDPYADAEAARAAAEPTDPWLEAARDPDGDPGMIEAGQAGLRPPADS